MSRSPHLSSLIIVVAVLASLAMRWDVFNTEVQGRHSWRQSQTGLNIRNFTNDDFNILNPRVGHYNFNECNIQRSDFPLMQWMIAAAQRLSVEHILVVRLCLLFLSLLTLAGVYKLSIVISGDRLISSITTAVFLFFPVFLYQSINLLPDNMALCFVLWMLYWFFKGIQSEEVNYTRLSFLFFGVAVLIKLPFIIFGVLYLKYYFEPSHRNHLLDFTLLLFSLCPAFFWYGWAIPDWNGNRITIGIFDNSIGVSLYLKFLKIQITDTFPKVILGLGLLIPFFDGAFALFTKGQKTTPYETYIRLGLMTSIFYFLFVLKQVREGHDYYMYPFLPWFCLIITLCLINLKDRVRPKKLLILVSLIIHPLISWLSIKDRWDLYQAYFNEDFFKYRIELKEAIPDKELCIILNDHSYYIVPYAIEKKGYVFMHNGLKQEWVEDLILRKDIKYMYSDSRVIDQNVDFTKYIEKAISSHGSVKVHKLISREALIHQKR